MATSVVLITQFPILSVIFAWVYHLSVREWWTNFTRVPFNFLEQLSTMASLRLRLYRQFAKPNFRLESSQSKRFQSTTVQPEVTCDINLLKLSFSSIWFLPEKRLKKFKLSSHGAMLPASGGGQKMFARSSHFTDGKIMLVRRMSFAWIFLFAFSFPSAFRLKFNSLCTFHQVPSTLSFRYSHRIWAILLSIYQDMASHPTCPMVYLTTPSTTCMSSVAYVEITNGTKYP